MNQTLVSLPLRSNEVSTASVQIQDIGTQESVLRHYWRLLIKRRWVIVGVVIAALIAGIALTLLTQREYRAAVTIQIERQTARIMEDVDDVQPTPGLNQEFYQTQYNLLKSRALAERVVRDLRLADDEQFLAEYNGDAEAWTRVPREARHNRATAIVASNLSVVPVRLSAVVSLQYTSPNAQMAANIANSLAENFIEANLQRRYEANSYARRFLEQRLAQVRQRLEASERQAVGYAAQQGIINVAPTSSDPQTQLSEQPLATADLTAMNAALAQARANRIAAEARYRQAQGGNQAVQMLQNPALNALRQQRATVAAELSRLSSDFGPEYPQVRALQQQLAEIDRSIGQVTGQIRQGVSQNIAGDYRQALAAEQQLAARVEQLKGDVLDVRRRSIQYNIFQRDVDTNRALYEALLQRYKEVGIAGGIGTNNVSIVDPARIPGAPFKPNLRLNLMLALLIGLALGVVVALLLDQLEEATIAPEDFQNKLGLPLLGSVPVLDKDEEPLEALRDRKHPLSEAYFSVLTGLQFSTQHGMPRSLLVTSTQPTEGKSTTALAIAQGLARIGRRVLLIDGDMRNPSVHKAQGIANTAGLSNLLTGGGSIEEFGHSTDLPNLSIMTAGPIPPNPAELLAGPALQAILADASSKYDVVVLDGPPIMGLADAPLLAQVVEATAFVLQAGKTRASQAQLGLRRLAGVGAYLVGAILTKFDTAKYGYGYGYGYDYSYGR